jgi:hypothetical protein
MERDFLRLQIFDQGYKPFNRDPITDRDNRALTTLNRPVYLVALFTHDQFRIRAAPLMHDGQTGKLFHLVN